MKKAPRRSDSAFVLSTRNDGVVATVDGMVAGALMVSGNDPRAAVAFLTRHGAERSDPVMGAAIEKLEGME
jgi:hypothetical protein